MSNIKIGDIFPYDSFDIESTPESKYCRFALFNVKNERQFTSFACTWGEEEAVAIIEAVSNHDRLTEEVERLTAQNKRMLAALRLVDENEEKLAQSWFDCGYHKVIDEILDEAQNANTKTNSESGCAGTKLEPRLDSGS